MVDYDPHQWRKHLLDIQGSMIKELFSRLLVVGLWSSAVVVFHYKVTPVAMPSTAHNLVGFALGLLLVFRTNASYDRFWEGRKLWGGIVNESRNLARTASVLLTENRTLRREVLQLAILFPYSVMHKLRGTDLVAPGFETDLEAPEFKEIAGSQHSSVSIAVKISGCIERARKLGIITDIQQGILDQNVQQLVDYLGGCERIHKTPLPFAYVVHLRRALLIYCFTLPFALVDTYKWETVVVTVLLTYVFLGIEEIGVEIEDPFGLDANDLPLERICDTIRKNVAALI